MQITSQFTIGLHMLTAIAHFAPEQAVTSSFLAESVGANPVIVRKVMGKLKDAGIILSSQGKTGIELAKEMDQVTLFDVYQAVNGVDQAGLFHFHEKPNEKCPVGGNIHQGLDDKLERVQAAMEAELRAISLADVVEGTEAAILANA